MSTQIPDDLLAAYVDGELDEAERLRVEQAIARDARLAQRVAQQRALRGRMRNAFERVLHEPVPQRLVNAARLKPPAARRRSSIWRACGPQRARRPERRVRPSRGAPPRDCCQSAGRAWAAGLLIEQPGHRHRPNRISQRLAARQRPARQRPERAARRRARGFECRADRPDASSARTGGYLPHFHPGKGHVRWLDWPAGSSSTGAF